ncbi:MAG: cysteine--tRNA ligase [Lachnospiraceae bacterium]|nr:cysteine--tRNA ligase [Lachnospiraceae bacterium]
MKVYNTLTRTKEEFVPIEQGKVSMYVCGPTVYNYIHIGNARPMIVFDTVRRYFEYKGYDVNYVSNFTDVDDKIIKKAIEEGVDSTEISERYIAAVKEDMKNLNVKEATTHPKATEEIDGMIEMIQTLIDKGYAYEKNGTVYYRTRAFKDYGKLSKKNIDELEAGHRDEAHQLKVSGEDEKEDSLDFVLWKPKKDGEPFWESPWSDGRPGWHIECSVMSKKYLGASIDIHAGGEDLIFPHHENEIAQSEACNGVEFAKYWLHNGFLNIDNKKMSKSEGNFFTVREIGEKYPYEVLRFFMLSGAHYRMPLNFSRDLMESAKAGLERIQTAVSALSYALENAKDGDITADEASIIDELKELTNKFEASMEDDFNTADAVSAVFEMVKITNSKLSSDNTKKALEEAKRIIVTLCDVLGIQAEKAEELLDADIEALIEERQQARKDRNFARADEIRDELLGKGIVLEDTREGVRWKRA